MIKDKIIEQFFGGTANRTVSPKGFLDAVKKQALERTSIPWGDIYRFDNKNWRDAIVVVGNYWDDISTFVKDGGTASWCEMEHGKHDYDPVTCKRCGQRFCIRCANATNVHLSKIIRGRQKKYMLCPMCMQDYYREVNGNEW